MKKAYRTILNQGKAGQQDLAKFLSNNGQILLPMVNLVEQCRLACDDLIAMAGRATLQAVLELSAAEQAGGPPQQGKRRNSETVFYGRQAGQVTLGDRQLEIERPRLRTRGRQSREVEVPAYRAELPPGKQGKLLNTRKIQHFSVISVDMYDSICVGNNGTPHIRSVIM